MPKVSVVIPCYNLGQYLDEAVDSVLAQTYQDLEIIIVNDGSTDEVTNLLLEKYRKPKTQVLRTNNQGLPSARNNGIGMSQGEYICCLDADDRYHPRFLEKCTQILDSDTVSKFGFVTTWARCFGLRDDVWETGDYNPANLIIGNQAHVASLFRKKAWEKVDGYSSNLPGYQDWDFWMKIVACGYSWTVVKEPLFDYRIRDDSMIKSSDQRRRELKEIILKNNSRFVALHAMETILEYDELIADILAKLSETKNKLQVIHESFVYKLLHRMNFLP
jgi:glycosyltransferase involved in cell wall biosynthesis